MYGCCMSPPLNHVRIAQILLKLVFPPMVSLFYGSPQLTQMMIGKGEVEEGCWGVLRIFVEVLLPHIVQQVVRVEEALRQITIVIIV